MPHLFIKLGYSEKCFNERWLNVWLYKRDERTFEW
jgi:hypothetical protein